jgi:hypothetical protein
LKEAEMAHSKEPYLRLAWFMHSKVTSQGWFEAFVMFNILMVTKETKYAPFGSCMPLSSAVDAS